MADNDSRDEGGVTVSDEVPAANPLRRHETGELSSVSDIIYVADEDVASAHRGAVRALLAVPDHLKPEIMQEANLMQLLADAITYRSTVADIAVILKCGAEVNAPVSRGLRPLHYAVYTDYVDCARLLIEEGADVNATDDIGYTPIHLCARKGNIRSMQLLIEHGATVDFMLDDVTVAESSRNLGYMTGEPVNLACENNHVACLKLLLDSGARPDHRYFMGYEVNLVPLDNLQCLDVLLEYGADPNVFNRCGVSPLMKACRQQNLPAARLLLDRGATVDLVSPPRFDQKTALHFAVASGNAALLHVLLRHGASPGRPEEYKYSALHTAVVSDRPDLADMLIKWGAQVDEQSDENATPLMLACATRPLSRQHDMVKLLLERGADVNASSSHVTFVSPAYLSPLVEYLRHAESDEDDVSMDVVMTLIRHGAIVHFTAAATNVRIKDPFGVINYLGHCDIRTNDALFRALVDNASVLDMDVVAASRHLAAGQKLQLHRLAKTPHSLRQAARFALRAHLRGPCFPDKVQSLPLPDVVKSYLLTG